MPSSSYGVLVEGVYDEPVLEVFVQRICAVSVPVFVLSAGGRTRVKRNFLGLLRAFEHITNTGGPVAKALVTCDSDLGIPQSVEQDLASRMGHQTYLFPDGIGFHAVKRAMETWLMADLGAINALVPIRERRNLHGPAGQLEDVPNPKGRFRELLDEAGLLYTPQVCFEIARTMDLTTLRARCPLFAQFAQKVLDP